MVKKKKKKTDNDLHNIAEKTKDLATGMKQKQNKIKNKKQTNKQAKQSHTHTKNT